MEKIVFCLTELTKRFGDFVAVRAVTLDIYDGEFLAIVGPSGSGKSTLLRMLAGLEAPSSGSMLLGGNHVEFTPANERPTCMVFQSLALFPHMSVGQNIEFPLMIRGQRKRNRRERAMELMQLLRLPEHYYHRRVTQCSGGERQRVALARSLAFDPQILFFDEPLSALDYRLRKTLEKELKDLQRQTRKTFVYVTHSLEEAMVMSDRIAVMDKGAIVQIGSPEEIYNRPCNRFVSQFMGDVNTLPVKRQIDGALVAEGLPGRFVGPAAYAAVDAGSLVIRPEDVQFLDSPDGAVNRVRGRLLNEYNLGSRVQYHVKVADHVFTIEKLKEQRLPMDRVAEDAHVWIGWDADKAVLVN